ncbi:MAG: hypothetical protein JWO03_3920 [Bacteroidetes bacterium]|nr:hypothetical protein [Bacteroidota bacterium]
MAAETYNVYKLKNEFSVWGYDYVAVSENFWFTFSFSDTHINYRRTDAELADYISEDYEPVSYWFQFDREALERKIFTQYREDHYTVTAYNKEDASEISSITITLGKGKSYVEHKFDVGLTSVKPAKYFQMFADFKELLSEAEVFKTFLFSRSE